MLSEMSIHAGGNPVLILGVFLGFIFVAIKIPNAAKMPQFIKAAIALGASIVSLGVIPVVAGPNMAVSAFFFFAHYAALGFAVMYFLGAIAGAAKER